MKTPSNIDRHLQLQLPIAHHHNMDEKAYKCPYAGCAFSTKHKYNLKRHEIVHTKEKKFPCTVCQYRAGTKVTLQKHMRGHEGTKSIYPSSAQAPISHHHVQVPQHQQQQQQQHTANHRHGSKVPSAPPGSLPHHHHHHHQNPVSRDPTGADDRPFMCHMCNYKGKLKSHLTRHLSMKSHNNGRQSHHQEQHQQQQIQQIQQPIQIPQPPHQNEYKPLPHTTSSLTVQAGSFAGFSPTLFKVPYYYPYVNVGGKPYS